MTTESIADVESQKLFEVESKFRVLDTVTIMTRLSELGASRQHHETHLDEYFAHPVRDFKQTDEAFRIRSLNGRHMLTYKGTKSGTTAKMRREIELPFAEEVEIADIRELLGKLSFCSVAVVEKTRQSFRIPRPAWKVTAALDEVKGLGTFLELEIVCAQANIENAEKELAEIAELLELSEPIRSSYLGLILGQSES
ncbi:MAG: class IV adenylate cyclase [Pirellulaceae bacterium]